MAVASTRAIAITFAGDFVASDSFSAANNAASPGSATLHTLSSGANTITVPTGGATVKGATIIPPAANAQSIILKGVTGDTGVTLSNTDPTSIAFETAPANFVLTAGGTITGLRIVWT